MSSEDQDRLTTGRRRPELDGKGMRVAIACGRFNDVITERLLKGARGSLESLGVARIEEVWAPGAFELPLVAKALAESGAWDAVITLGAVIRGGTPHFEYVAGECAAGVLRVGLDTGVPVVFGVLTVDNVEQAEERSVEGPGNKGAESAETAVEMAQLLRSIR
jgi:6,7-dimethyl-8-ribityllumazine synthase